jgi:hypothetical protein
MYQNTFEMNWFVGINIPAVAWSIPSDMPIPSIPSISIVLVFALEGRVLPDFKSVG